MTVILEIMLKVLIVLFIFLYIILCAIINKKKGYSYIGGILVGVGLFPLGFYILKAKNKKGEIVKRYLGFTISQWMYIYIGIGIWGIIFLFLICGFV